jgi:hypothetical protein
MDPICRLQLAYRAICAYADLRRQGGARVGRDAHARLLPARLADVRPEATGYGPRLVADPSLTGAACGPFSEGFRRPGCRDDLVVFMGPTNSHSARSFDLVRRAWSKGCRAPPFKRMYPLSGNRLRNHGACPAGTTPCNSFDFGNNVPQPVFDFGRAAANTDDSADTYKGGSA